MAQIHFVNEFSKAGSPNRRYARVLDSPIFFNTKCFAFAKSPDFFPDSFYLIAKMLSIQKNFSFENQLKNKQSQLVKTFEQLGVLAVYADAASFKN